MYTLYIDVRMGKSPRRLRISSGARFNLGEPWDGRLADFCAAHFKGSATDVVRAALEVFIPMELARDLATSERYQKLQEARERDKADAKTEE
jgi:hypothetical protein